MADQDVAAELMAHLGVTSPEKETEDPEETETTTETETETEEQETETVEEESSEDGEEPSKKPDAEKALKSTLTPQEKKAFAEQRIQIKSQKQVIDGIAGLLGLDPKTPDLVDQVQSAILNAQAKKENIDPNLLAQINQSSAAIAELNSIKLEAAAKEGLTDLIDTYELEKEDVDSFLNELIKDGLNPLEQPVNLKHEYIDRHFKDVQEKIRTKALAEEQARKDKTSKASSVPGKGGESEDVQGSIRSTGDLRTFLNSHEKK